MTEEHRWIVDRFEGELAVVEVDGEQFLDVPRWLLPADAREGDVLRVARRPESGEAVALRIEIDREATARARREVERLVEELRRKDPGGDVVL